MNIYVYIIFFGIVFAQDDIFEGYTLFTPQIGFGGETNTLLIDNDYNIIQSWSHNNGPSGMPYLIKGDEPGLENSLLLYSFRVDNPTMQSGGVGGGIHCLNWEGNILWEFILSDDDFQQHHDIEPLPNGNVLLIAWERKTASEAYAMGREEINNPLNQMWSSAIFEIKPNENGTADIVWEWHLWDHLVQDYCIDCPNYKIVSEHPELFNINNGEVGSQNQIGQANADWIHFNAIDYHEEWDQIVLSSRYQNEIFVIDHSTTTEEAASHTGGNYDKGGDFLYRWGNPQNYNRGNTIDQIISDQHGINWILDGYPGSGNFILFNNYHMGMGPWGESAVLEFIPPVDLNGNYHLDNSVPYGPENYYWIYEGDIFSAMQGGATRLPNGNTLIVDCDSAHIIEVNNNGQVVWEYTNTESVNVSIANAQKYSLEYFTNNEYIEGDINDDGNLNVLDIVLLVNYVLSSEYNSEFDLNGDGGLNILDIVYLVNLVLDDAN